MSQPVQPESGSPTGPSRGVVAAGVVVAAVALLGAFLTVTTLLGGGSDPAAAATPTAGEPTPAQTTQAALDGDKSVCGLDSVEESGTVTVAPKTTWTLLGSAAVPAVDQAGPGEVEDDGFRSCFARTPTGALVAAGNLAGMGSVSALESQMVDKSVVPGPGRDAALAQPSGGDGDTTGVQIAGFRVLRYDGEQADIDIALRVASSGALASFVYNLQWDDGDWKLRVADTGDMLSQVAPIPSLAGYTPWAGA